MSTAPLNQQLSPSQISLNGGKGLVQDSRKGPESFELGPNRRWNDRGGILCGMERVLLRKILAHLGNPAIRVVLWNGEEVVPSGPTIGCLKIHDRATLWKLAWNHSIAFGDAYMSGHITIEGNLIELLTSLFDSMRKIPRIPSALDIGSYTQPRRTPRTTADSRESVHHHYDIGNDFYKLWLDEQLVYTCAYFADPGFSLEQAQVAKLDHVCRKLKLSPGQTVVEAGFGWGALSLHMAAKYGVTVKAFNLSHEQTTYARARARDAGLDDRIEFIEDDYRNISGEYDAFVSVGMLEHVGVANYVDLGKLINRSLKPSGLGLIHSIGRNVAAPMDPWTEKRIFPGAHPPSLREMMDIFEPSRFSILDIENLRLHYARTLEFWLERFEKAAEKVSQMFDESFVRAWRLYLAASAATFASDELQLFQVVFAPPANNHIPWTRTHLYSAC